MEIITKQFEMSRLGKLIGNQFMVDEDYNVPDSKQDVKRVVMSEGILVIDEIKPVEKCLRFRGRMKFQILYETDDFSAAFASLEGNIPFDEVLYLDEENFDDILLKNHAVDLKVSIIHSRKLRIKAVIDLAVQPEQRKYEEIPTDVICDCKIHKKQEKLELLKLHTSKRDACRIKEEIMLTGTKESIGNILWTDFSNRKLDIKLTADQIQLSGELLVFCFYESPDGKIDWIEQVVPYSGKIECYGVDETMFHHVQAELEDIQAEMRMDEDGEMRMIAIEGVLRLSVGIYEEEGIEVLRDLYSLDRKCILETKEAICEQLVLQNYSKCKVMERLAVPELQNDVLQICHSKGRVLVEEMEQKEDGVLVSGVMYISFLYVKSSDEVPFDVWHGMIPFSHLVECNGRNELKYDISTMLEQLSVTLQGGNEVEVKAVLAFQGIFRNEEIVMKIDAIRMEPISLEEIEKRPGIVGYVAKEGEDLWDLAKRYSTSVEAIREVNELGDRLVKAGDRLLIFKENMSIL
mgnify:CR=1 FL=1